MNSCPRPFGGEGGPVERDRVRGLGVTQLGRTQQGRVGDGQSELGIRRLSVAPAPSSQFLDYAGKDSQDTFRRHRWRRDERHG